MHFNQFYSLVYGELYLLSVGYFLKFTLKYSCFSNVINCTTSVANQAGAMPSATEWAVQVEYKVLEEHIVYG